MDDLQRLLVLIGISFLQGLTEILPVSSTGHLALARQFLPAEAAFSLHVVVALHAGSLLAITYWYRRDLGVLWQHVRASLTSARNWIVSRGSTPLILTKDQRIPYYMVISLVPVAIEGFLLRNWTLDVFERGSAVPALLAVNGLLIWTTARWTRGERGLRDLKLWEFLFIGFVQGFAVFPGISRLGITLCAGLWRQLNWYEALRLSFILSIPVIVGANVLEAREALPSWLALAGSQSASLASVLIVFVVSLGALRLFTSAMLGRPALVSFGYYCCMVGVFTLTYFAFWK